MKDVQKSKNMKQFLGTKNQKGINSRQKLIEVTNIWKKAKLVLEKIHFLFTVNVNNR